MRYEAKAGQRFAIQNQVRCFEMPTARGKGDDSQIAQWQADG
jgi:hypothetical protein